MGGVVMGKNVLHALKKVFKALTAVVLLAGLVPLSASPATVRAAEIKTFDISAIDLVIAINRFGDNDPLGKMFVLNENIPAVQARLAIPLSNPDRVNIGLRDDP